MKISRNHPNNDKNRFLLGIQNLKSNQTAWRWNKKKKKTFLVQLYPKSGPWCSCDRWEEFWSGIRHRSLLWNRHWTRSSKIERGAEISRPRNHRSRWLWRRNRSSDWSLRTTSTSLRFDRIGSDPPSVSRWVRNPRKVSDRSRRRLWEKKRGEVSGRVDHSFLRNENLS